MNLKLETPNPKPYDALLVVSYGGPEGIEDVIPFLETVLAGRPVPRARLEAVAHHYRLFGGISPLNAQNRALIAALKAELAAHNLPLPIYLGNRNWHPFLVDTLRRMAN
ncbi:MAG: ferrochelatase, partial [Anaerolineae bacterium]